MTTILVIDDEPSIRKAITLSLKDEGHKVLDAESKAQAFELLESHRFDLVVADLFIPTESDGLAILEACKKQQPEAMVIIMTAHSSIERAVSAVKAGADDFLQKGFPMEELKLRIERLLEQKKLREENRQLNEKYRRLQNEVEGRYRFKKIIGTSKAMGDLLELLGRVVDDGNSTVLLQGESGTGKELLARALHYNGPRVKNPFIVVNCATLPEHLVESELFGHEKGAFTGAVQAKEGKFELADTGTLFIDEVAEITPKVQVELLRFIQERTFERLGGNRTITVDVRIVAASNRDLETEVAKGRFREDLFYRLNVIPIRVPALRERKEDIPLLVNHFIEKFQKAKGRKIRFSKEALSKLEDHNWPGNVREVENLIERLVVTALDDTIRPNDLPAQSFDKNQKELFETEGGSLKDARQEFEKQLILRELQKQHWNITKVATVLGERRDTLSRKITRYGLKSSKS